MIYLEILACANGKIMTKANASIIIVAKNKQNWSLYPTGVIGQ